MMIDDEPAAKFRALVEPDVSRELQLASKGVAEVITKFAKDGRSGVSMHATCAQVLGQHFALARQHVTSAVAKYLKPGKQRVSAGVVQQRRAAAVKVLDQAALRFRGAFMQGPGSDMAQAAFQEIARRECGAFEVELTLLLPLSQKPTADSAQYRLAAILLTDIVGFTKLAIANGPATFDDVQACEAIQREIVARRGGKVIKGTGDGTMSEFASAVAALEAAVEIQSKVSASNVHKPPERHIVIRAGIAIGDVRDNEDGDDIYGTCAIIAERLQAIAAPGTICLPASLHDDLASKVPFEFKDLGLRSLKNLARQMHVCQVDPKVHVTLKTPAEVAAETLFNLERAYLTGGGDVETAEGERLFRVEVANHGKTPAHLFAFDVRFATLEEVKAELLPVDQQHTFDDHIPPNNVTRTIGRVPITRPNADIIFGAFWYRDVRGAPDHVVRFILRVAEDDHTRSDVKGVHPDYTQST
jgi:class 3 adenylate cyclase